jgi:hypothetical protein
MTAPDRYPSPIRMGRVLRGSSPYRWYGGIFGIRVYVRNGIHTYCVIFLWTNSPHTLGGSRAARGNSSPVMARAGGPVPFHLEWWGSYGKGDGSMKRSLMCAVFVSALVVSTAVTGWAQSRDVSGGRPIPQQQPPLKNLQSLTPQQQIDQAELALNAQTAVACQFCFTCGGDWPVFAGFEHLSPDPGGHFQRGPACAGPLQVQPAGTDLFPFLCCR